MKNYILLIIFELLLTAWPWLMTNFGQVMVILFVLIVVGLSVVHMTPPDAGPRVNGEKIKLEDILGNKFKPNTLNATWNQGE